MSIIEYDGKKIDCDDKYSFKDFTNESLSNAKDLDNKIIFSSCFSKEIPDTKVFPDNMKGVAFYNCNLDNIYIPAGNTLIGCRNNRFKVQNDLRDWIIDKDDKPIKVMDEKMWEMQGYSVDPKDIPLVKLKSIEEIKKVK